RDPYLDKAYLIDASILSSGFQMLLYPGILYAANVGSITCIKPFEGVPRLALISQLFIARGFPFDSVFIWYSNFCRLLALYEPVILSAFLALRAHPCTAGPVASCVATLIGSGGFSFFLTS